jgi:CRP/FNR family transcriptional regulator, cyclic AMP receptor protein
MRLERAAIAAAIHREPAFSKLFIAHLLGRAIRVEADFVDQLFNSSEKCLARLLLLLANFGKEAKVELAAVKISQETLAEPIGTARLRVCFFMNKCRKLGFIDYNGSIEAHSSLLNVVLLDDPHIKSECALFSGARSRRSDPREIHRGEQYCTVLALRLA